MHTNRSLFGLACRATAVSLLMAGTATLLHAQQAVSAKPATQFFLASSAVPDFTASSSSGYSSSSDDVSALVDEHFDSKAANPDSTQPPPRRRYGRPNYSDSHTNPDGSNKWTGMAGAGVSLATGITHKYQTESYAFQAGFGRNFNKTTGVLLQFDYDHFGLQGSTLANQQYLYNYGVSAANQISGLDGNNHVWSFTVDPTFTVPSEGAMGAYVVAGAGFYHKVTNFTVPAVGTYCDFFYGCFQYQANQLIDHYTSNALGVNGGFGLTYKFSHFSNERFYVEARYVVAFNQHRVGLTASNISTPFGASYRGNNFYPANSNRTTYVPITFGIRF